MISVQGPPSSAGGAVGAGSDRPELLFVPGAFHGGWMWRELVERLREDGWGAQTLDLPSTAGRRPDAGVYADAAAIRDALAAQGRPTVVVAHCYGGIPATQAATAVPNVAHLVYVAAFQLDLGDCLLSELGRLTPAWMVVEDTRVLPHGAEDVLYHDVEPQLSVACMRRLRPTNLAAVVEPLTRPSWRRIDSTYIVCEDDRAIPVEYQDRMSLRAREVRRLPGGHMPMMTRTGEFTSLIQDIVTSSVRCEDRK